MEKQCQNKPKQALNRALVGTAVFIGSTTMALAEGEAVSIDLTTGLAGVAIVAGIMAAGGLKALPTYAAWGVKKALAMLR